MLLEFLNNLRKLTVHLGEGYVVITVICIVAMAIIITDPSASPWMRSTLVAMLQANFRYIL